MTTLAMNEALNVQRNQKWVRRLIANLKTGKVAFIAVGTLHLFGPHGLKVLLKKEGFELSIEPTSDRP